MEGERLAPVIELRPEGEMINGVHVLLGRLSLTQLEAMEAAAKLRVMDAQTDVWMLQGELERRCPDGSAS